MDDHFTHHLNDMLSAAFEHGAATERLTQAQLEEQAAGEEVADAINGFFGCFKPQTVQ